MTSLLDKFADTVVDAFIDATGGIEKHSGIYGEWQTRNELRFTKLLGKKGKILKNLYVPKVTVDDSGEEKTKDANLSDMETTEIDTLFITQKGIFVIEVKNYSGWIFGNEKDRYWTQTFPNGKKYRFFNPVLQNRGHIKHLADYLNGEDNNENIPFFSMISFLDNRSELKKITVTSPNVWVIRSNEIYKTIRDVWDSTPDVLNSEQVESLYKRIKPLTRVDKETKERHIAEIKEKKMPEQHTAAAAFCSERAVRKEQVPPNDLEENYDTEICPRCGGKLILRTAKKGEYAGNQFYGCSNYPKCRFTKQMDNQGETSITQTMQTVHEHEIEPHDMEENDLNGKCPRCGGDLVLRTAKKGKYAGNQFYGCSNYPKCRFSKSL